MGKFDLSYENTDEILETIKKIILDKYPIVENRIDLLSSYPSPAMDITLGFYRINNKDEFTQILFSNGTEKFKQTIPERININGLVTIKIIISLINFILSDHDYIKDISKDKRQLKLNFNVNMKDENMRGISCGEINLILDFSSYQNCEVLLNYFLKKIVNNFYPQLQYTQKFKEEYYKYCMMSKEKIINSLTDEELQLFIRLLNKDDLRMVLNNIPNDYFFELYKNFKTQKRSDQNILTKKIN